MSRSIRESDWKLFRELRPVALERFCERVLGDIVGIAGDRQRTAHQRYLAAFELVRQRDKALAAAFDDPRRSTALLQLALIHSEGLLTEDEFGWFSAEARESVTWRERI